ncbi:hypothetical protein Dsin_014703 [Dipteronia sinensis]|uniref:Uncharacterized protein n=1 Tax=Dipteronia sinensis TaxID=43782 RepID=A0AAE0EA26_9ROSI|nr:hypothetical protein Dsin_014703 [Dipteronia sinensis]
MVALLENQNWHLDIAASQNGEQIGSFGASTGSQTTLASCWDIGSEQNTQQDSDSLHSPYRQNSMPQRGTVGAVTTKNHAHRRTNSPEDWSVGSASDGSLFDSTNSPEDNLPREWREGSGSSVEKLRNEIAMMMRQAELTEIELQSLRKQIVKESKQAQDQTRQVISLSEERDSLRKECKQLRRQKSIDDAAVESQLLSENGHLRAIQEEIRQELNHENEMKTNLQLQLQKTQDSNSELMLAVEDPNEILEQKNREIKTSKSAEGEHQLALKELEKEIDMLRQKVGDRDDEIEFFSKHMEELEMHMEQLTQDNEVLKQENSHLSSKLERKLLESIKTCNESSESLATMKELESQVERPEEKMKQQSQDYSESLIAINELESQEQKAIRAEEALRNTRWKNAVPAERLQEEFKRLSVDMASKLDENDKLAMNAHAEANELPKKEAEKAHEELISMRFLRDENKMMVGNLQSEVEKLKVQHSELKNSLIEVKLEKDNLRKQVFQLKDELPKKEEEITSTEKEFENYGANSGSVRENNLSIKTEEQESTIEQVKIAPVHGYKHANRKEETCSEKKLNVPTSHASDAGNLTELLSEVTLLKERTNVWKLS